MLMALHVHFSPVLPPGSFNRKRTPVKRRPPHSGWNPRSIRSHCTVPCRSPIKLLYLDVCVGSRGVMSGRGSGILVVPDGERRWWEGRPEGLQGLI